MAYDNIEIGDTFTDAELEKANVNIYNNSLIAVPTGNVASDGSPEVEIKTFDML